LYDDVEGLGLDHKGIVEPVEVCVYPERAGLDFRKTKKEKIRPGDGALPESSKGMKESASIFGLINRACNMAGDATDTTTITSGSSSSSASTTQPSSTPILTKRQESDLRQDLLKSSDHTRALEGNLEKLYQSLERNKRNASLSKHIKGEIDMLERRLQSTQEQTTALRKAIHKKKEDRKSSKHLF